MDGNTVYNPQSLTTLSGSSAFVVNSNVTLGDAVAYKNNFIFNFQRLRLTPTSSISGDIVVGTVAIPPKSIVRLTAYGTNTTYGYEAYISTSGALSIKIPSATTETISVENICYFY